MIGVALVVPERDVLRVALARTLARTADAGHPVEGGKR